MRTTGDLCPGALRLHEAADGFLARVRCPGGLLDGAQVEALCRAADDLGDGSLDLTSRGNVQVRGLRAPDAAALQQVLVDAGLLPSATHERARNVLASPLSGLDGRGRLDVTPLVAKVDRSLCETSQLAGLSGRFLLAVDDGRGDVAALGPDLALVAVDARRLALAAGRVDTGLRVPVADAAALLVEAAARFLDLRDEQGAGAWRVRELDGGAAALVDRLRCLPSGLAGVEREAVRADLVPTGVAEAGAPVGPLRQVDGRTALGVAVPLGRLTSAQARALASVSGQLRLSPWHVVVVPDVPAQQTSETTARLARLGLVLDPTSPWVGVSACAGAGACARARADVRRDAAQAVALEGTAPGPAAGGAVPPVRVHWSGCERRCGRPATGALDVVAGEAGYRLRAPGAAPDDGTPDSLSRRHAALAVVGQRTGTCRDTFDEGAT